MTVSKPTAVTGEPCPFAAEFGASCGGMALDLTREDIQAAMRNAADTLARGEVVLIEDDPADSRV